MGWCLPHSSDEEHQGRFYFGCQETRMLFADLRKCNLEVPVWLTQGGTGTARHCKQRTQKTFVTKWIKDSLHDDLKRSYPARCQALPEAWKCLLCSHICQQQSAHPAVPTRQDTLWLQRLCSSLYLCITSAWCTNSSTPASHGSFRRDYNNSYYDRSSKCLLLSHLRCHQGGSN